MELLPLDFRISRELSPMANLASANSIIIQIASFVERLFRMVDNSVLRIVQKIAI